MKDELDIKNGSKRIKEENFVFDDKDGKFFEAADSFRQLCQNREDTYKIQVWSETGEDGKTVSLKVKAEFMYLSDEMINLINAVEKEGNLEAYESLVRWKKKADNTVGMIWNFKLDYNKTDIRNIRGFIRLIEKIMYYDCAASGVKERYYLILPQYEPFNPNPSPLMCVDGSDVFETLYITKKEFDMPGDPFYFEPCWHRRIEFSIKLLEKKYPKHKISIEHNTEEGRYTLKIYLSRLGINKRAVIMERLEYKNMGGDLLTIHKLLDAWDDRKVIGNGVFTMNGINSGIGGIYTLGMSSAVHVKLPEGVTKIEDRAFYNSNVTTVTLPQTLKYIGDEAFLSQMNTIIVPKNVTHIGKNAFKYFFEVDERNKKYIEVDGKLFERSDTDGIEAARREEREKAEKMASMNK